MKIKNLLLEKKPGILKKWFNLILDTYPSDTSDFLKLRNNISANPVSRIISEGIEGLFNILVSGADPEKRDSLLDSIVRIRAIQDFTAAEAVGFIFQLKKVIRDDLDVEIREQDLYEELLEVESEIDELIRAAFDIYMKCREKLYELKANEMRNWTYRAVKRSKAYREVKAEG